MPEVEPKKTPRARPTCKKCFEIGHKQKKCPNQDPEEKVKERRKIWELRRKQGKKNYNERYSKKRAFDNM